MLGFVLGFELVLELEFVLELDVRNCLTVIEVIDNKSWDGFKLYFIILFVWYKRYTLKSHLANEKYKDDCLLSDEVCLVTDNLRNVNIYVA